MKSFVLRDDESLCALAADHVARRIHEAVEARGRCTLFLSGGKTPIPLYERLAKAPHADAIPWDVVWIGWVDERCVPPTHEKSNSRAVLDSLIKHVPIPEAQILRIRGELKPLDAADDYEVALKRILSEDEKSDLVILGMGEDGHTASLFPGQQALRETLRWVLPVHAPAEPRWRVTLTLPFIHRSRSILFLVTGERKANAILRVRNGEDLPAARIKPPSGEVVWFLDRAAAGG